MKRSTKLVSTAMCGIISALSTQLPAQEQHASVKPEPTEIRTSGNPLFKNIWTADPAALVVGDTLYLYVGHDDAHGNQMFNITGWRCYSTKDLVNWKDYGDVLTSADFKYGQKNTSWAAQVIKKGDTYFWYVTIRNDKYGGQSINVATSDTPVGPWKTYEKPVVTDDMTKGFMPWNVDGCYGLFPSAQTTLVLLPRDILRREASRMAR